MAEIQTAVAEAKALGLEDMAVRLEAAVNKLGEVAMHLGKTAMSPDIKVAFAHATPFLDAMGDVCMGWMLLWRARVATEKQEGAKKKDAAFYEGQIKSAEFFIHTVLPVTMGKMESLMVSSPAAVAISEEAFGGK
jgi:hypothetical protein